MFLDWVTTMVLWVWGRFCLYCGLEKEDGCGGDHARVIKCGNEITYQSSWGSCLLMRFPVPSFPHFCLCHRLNTWWHIIRAHNMMQYMLSVPHYTTWFFCKDFAHYTKCCLKLGVCTTANLNWLFVYFFFARWLYKNKKVPRKYIIIILQLSNFLIR